MNPRLSTALIALLALAIAPTASAQQAPQGVASHTSSSKHTVALKFLGLSAHPTGSPQPELSPSRLDDGGCLVIDLGGMASYGYPLVLTMAVGVRFRVGG